MGVYHQYREMTGQSAAHFSCIWKMGAILKWMNHGGKTENQVMSENIPVACSISLPVSPVSHRGTKKYASCTSGTFYTRKN